MTWPLPAPRLAVAAVVGAMVVLVVPDQGRMGLAGLVLDTRFLAVNVVLLAAAVLDGVLAPSPAGVVVRREHARAVILDQPTSMTWEIESGSRRRWGSARRVWLADQLAPSLRAATRRVQVRLPVRGSVRASVEMRPSRRGRFEPEQMVVRTSGPMGLVHKQRSRSLRSSLKVLPPFRSAREAELSLRRARILEIGLRSARGRGGGTEFDSLRDLTPDDETRRIDWAATASVKPVVTTVTANLSGRRLLPADHGAAHDLRRAAFDHIEEVRFVRVNLDVGTIIRWRIGTGPIAARYAQIRSIRKRSGFLHRRGNLVVVCVDDLGLHAGGNHWNRN